MPQRESDASRQLFDQVVEASGLSSIIARAAIARACVRAQVDSSLLTPESLGKLIPHLQQTLDIYLREEAALRIRRIKALMHRPPWQIDD